MVKKISVSSPGKIILSGEHSVVYGQPALVTAIDKRLFVEVEKNNSGLEITCEEEKDLAEFALFKIGQLIKEDLNNLTIKISSQISARSGLGSSAALAVALTTTIFVLLEKKLDKNLINQIAYEIEKKQHGKPSGCDNSISTFGGTIVFRRGKVKTLKINKSFPFVLINSGKAAESTKEMVTGVRRNYQFSKSKYQNILEDMGEVTIQLIKEFKKGNFNQLKKLIIKNEELLEKLSVVGGKAKGIIREIEQMGGAAKICGAGGIKAGSGMILTLHQDLEKLKKFLEKQNWQFFETEINQEGVRLEF